MAHLKVSVCENTQSWSSYIIPGGWKIWFIIAHLLYLQRLTLYSFVEDKPWTNYRGTYECAKTIRRRHNSGDVQWHTFWSASTAFPISNDPWLPASPLCRAPYLSAQSTQQNRPSRTNPKSYLPELEVRSQLLHQLDYTPIPSPLQSTPNRNMVQE
jgi:hypothetical protein